MDSLLWSERPLYTGEHKRSFLWRYRSKKSRGWRTFLVVPELDQELTVWTDRKPLFDQLATFENMLADYYKHLDASSTEKPQVSNVVQEIRRISHEMDQEYGVLGSLFRTGSRTTFFASQVERYLSNWSFSMLKFRYADIYAPSCYNLVHYPSFYFFRAPMQLMPHESTVDHGSIVTTTRADTFKRQESVGNQGTLNRRFRVGERRNAPLRFLRSAREKQTAITLLFFSPRLDKEDCKREWVLSRGRGRRSIKQRRRGK